MIRLISKPIRQQVVATTAAVSLVTCSFDLAWAAPEGGQVVGGSGSILQSGKLTEINQSSQRMAIDWQRFDVAADERVRFIQPGKDAIALNRILDSKASTILGRVDANGTLFLVNPRGIIFGKGAVINAASLVASDLNIDPDEFMSGNYHFANDDMLLSSGVLNQGEIEAAVGGSVTLLGTVVSNEGRIATEQGSIRLVAADEVVISFEPDADIGVLVNKALLHNDSGEQAAVANTGELIARGGQVLLAGHVTSDLYTQAVNNQGIIEATSLEVGEGYIELSGNGGDVVNSGVLDASGAGDLNGGTVKLVAGNIDNSGTIDVSGAEGGSVYQQAQTILRHSGNSVVDASGRNGVGGTVEMYGERVGLLDSTRVTVSGESGGGTLLVGGDFQGAGEHRAQITVVGDDVVMEADAITAGDGGKVIVWSDDSTVFRGQILSRGGSEAGDGGFVEVSGKQNLQFLGHVDTSAANGSMGSLLLDPATLTILNGAAGGAQDADILDGLISQGDGGSVNYLITESVLESLTSNVTIEARDSITINDLADDVLCFHCTSGAGDVTFRISGSPNTAFFTMNTGDTIQVSSGNLLIEVNTTDGDTATITTGDLFASGNISVLAHGDGGSGFFGPVSGDVSISTGNITSTAGNINVSASVAADAGFSSFTTAGDASVNTGSLNVTGNGNIDVFAESTMNAVFTFGTSAGNTSISMADVSIGGAGTIDATARSAGSGIAGNGSETLLLNGNLSAGSVGNNGFIALDSNAITISGNRVLAVTNDGSGANPIILTTGGFNGAGNALTLDVGAGTFAGISWNNFSNINTLTLQQANSIYLASAGAGAGDVTLSQANFNTIDNFTNNLNVVAGNNIVSGAASYNNYSNVSLTAANNFSTTAASTSTGANYSINAATMTLNHGLASAGGTATLTASGDISANSSITSGGGNVALTSTGGNVVMGAAGTLNAGSGLVAIAANGNVALTGITTTNATASAVDIQATNGSIIDAGDLVADITATSAGAVVTLSAAAGIGDDATATDFGLEINSAGISAVNTSANDIDLNLTGNVLLDGAIDNQAAGGGLLIAATGSMTVDSAVTTNDGVIDLAAATNLTMTDTATIDAGVSTVVMAATNTIAVSSVTTTSASATAVQITSSAGSIIDAGDLATDITALNGTVVLSAANGIGDDASATDLGLEINAANVSASNTTANNINLSLTGNVVLDGSISNSASGGGIVLDSSGSMTVDSLVATNNGVVDLTAGTSLTMTDAGTINSGSGNIALAATNDIAITSLITTSASPTAVQVTSTSGAIIDGDSSDDTDITASNGSVVLSAANGIGDDATASDLTLEINAADVAATNSSLNNIDLALLANTSVDSAISNSAAGGSLLLNGTGSLALNAGLSTNNGLVDIVAGTSLTMTDSGSINTGTGDIVLAATNDIAVTSLTSTATATAVQITSTSGAIVDGDTAENIDITAINGTVALSAANGIGDDNTAADLALEINAADVNASNTTANNIDLALTGNVLLDGGITNNATAGALLIDASGSLTVDSLVTTNNGDVGLTAGTSLSMTDTGAVNAGSGDIALTAVNDIAVTALTTTSSSTTAVQVSSSSGAIIDGDSSDNLDISAVSGTVVLNAANGIGDDATANDYTLEIDEADISATNTTANNIALALSGNVSLDSAITNTATGGGLVLAAAGSLAVNTALSTSNGIVDLTAGTSLTMLAGSSIDAGDSLIDLSALNDIALTSLTTTNNTASAVQVTSSAGAILDGDSIDDLDISASAAGAVVTLNAATGIGSAGNALELNTPAVVAATTTGDVVFSNAGNLTVAGISSGNGAIAVSTGGNLQVDGAVTTGAGSVTLSSGADVVINNAVSSSNTAIQVDAADDLTVTASGSVNAGSGAVALSADAGVGDAVGALTIAAGGSVSGGDVSLASAETLSVTGVQGSSVTLTSAADIVDSDTAATDVVVTNPALALTLNAASGVGLGDALETDTRNLVLATDVAQVISNSGDVLVSGLAGHSGGDITVASSGDLTLAASSIADTSALDLSAGGDVGIAALTSAGALTASATTLSLGSVSVDSLATTAATSVGTSLATTNSLSAGTVTLNTGASLTSGSTLATGTVTAAASGSHSISSIGDMNIAAISGSGASVQLTSATDMTLGTVSLGSGNFSAQVDSDANQVATLSVGAVSAGNITLAGGADNNDQVLVSGQLSGNTISAINLGRLDLQRVQAAGTLTLEAADMRLSNDLVAMDTLLVSGGISLLGNVLLDSTGGGAASGSLVELGGTVAGGGFNLSLDAGSHVACTENAVISGVGTFAVTDSIKTVLGSVSANTIQLRSSQEIHLNQSITAASATFNADTNLDSVGVVSLLSGQSINASSVTLVGVTAQVSASTPATCTLPTGLPEMPVLVDPSILAIAAQESERFEETAKDTFASNAPNVTYLDTSCQPSRQNSKAQQDCALDESVRNFLGTFLIDFQLPGS